MKRLWIVIMIAVSMTAYAQGKKYIDGYKGLPWGSSVDAVRAKYPDIQGSDDFLRTGVSVYFTADKATVRYFTFYNGKLYHVSVLYMLGLSVDEIVEKGKALANKLKSTYGEPTKVDKDGQVAYWELKSDLRVTLAMKGAAIVIYECPSIIADMAKDVEL